MDSHARSIAKTLSWRFIATIITTVVAYVLIAVIGQHARLAFAIGLLDTTIKLGIYFIHERVWNKIDYGREGPKPPDYEI